ncbi:enoyl-CoA hydratase/carnithine racemase [Novosphingobium sp. SG751A]|uniref:enoyl-CoA hydratase-related protein n=1 Tax=Novosphingobium sp. SG751A TaxID=2587000 RepID=UPI001555878D|nr:enoyl-CoA hydratase/carnithine racemase [Novosphingobium sp. SG751A]
MNQLFVRTEILDGGIGIVTIDRPARRNALSIAVKRQLAEAMAGLVADQDVRAIILTGANGVFVAGTDIAEMKDMQPASHAQLQTGAIFEQLRSCGKVLLAAVEGYALGGGCELALACDLVIAGESAKFGLPEIRVGIMPGAGGTQMLLRAAGKHRTLRYVLTGDMIPAPQALSLGIVSEVVGEGEALRQAIALARRIVAMPPLSLRAIRDCVDYGLNAGLAPSLAYERQAFVDLFATEDQKEGMEAFLDKREAQYKGR